MSKGREFQIVGAATEKLIEPKYVRTRGTDSSLVSYTDHTETFADRPKSTKLTRVGFFFKI